ncbi:MAG TPA: DUF3082 domain-containing protein [Kamptonema sp.]|nr:DUF3082 domain-containing protein [Kamptonema sp.]
MTNLTNPTPNSQPPNPVEETSILRCITGSLIAGAFASGLYLLTASIAQTFASKPTHSDNITVIKIASAVRTLVVGMAALGTGVFALAALGLMGLAIQLLIQRLRKRSHKNSSV